MGDSVEPQSNCLLKIENLTTRFSTYFGAAKAVDGITFDLKEGETLGIVGESGSGKTVTALSILKLLPNSSAKIIAGSVHFQGKDLIQCNEDQMSKIRGNQIAMIFQEPMTSLNPVFSIGYQLSEMFRLHKGFSKKKALKKSIEMLRLVQIPSPEKRIHEYPYEISGGMRQRVMIAMAICCNPLLLIADEPTTALDVTIQAQILDLIENLKKLRNMAVIFISHDLGVVANVAERVLVMYAGKIVEEGKRMSIFEKPLHPYTRCLLKAIPRIDYSSESHPKRLYEIKGTIPSIYDRKKGCNFYARCEYRENRCRYKEPQKIEIDSGHRVSCWRHY